MTSNTDTDLAHAGQTPDLMALAAEGTHPGWLVLDSARAALFTGEIIFTNEPEIRVYLDHGVAYHAVRAGEPSLCSRLLEAGVVEPIQIERGVVRVGNVEHLGRLFDRDSTVDRDAVTVFVELATDAVLTEVANRPSSVFTITPYRHHVSGIHRWFVAPIDPSQLAPIGQVAQIDGSVTSVLPGLPVSEQDEPTDELSIVWDHPAAGSGPVDEQLPLHTIDESMLQSILDDPTDTEPVAAESAESAGSDPAGSNWTQPEGPAALQAPEASTPLLGLDEFVVMADPTPSEEPPVTAAVDDDFQIVWPDGTEQVFPAPYLDDISGVPAARMPAHLAEEPAATTEVMAPAGAAALDEQADHDGAVSHIEEPDAVTPAGDVIAPNDLADPNDAADQDDVADQHEPSIRIGELSLLDPQADAAAPDEDQGVPTVTIADDGAFRFEIPPLALTTDATPSEQQPEDVVAAVRRALAAIESAATGPTVLRPIGEPDIPGFATTTAPSDEPADLEDAVSIDIDDSPAGLVPDSVDAPTESSLAMPQPIVGNSFAPPTLEASAEALYARGEAGVQTEAARIETNAAPASGVASVVFVDDEADGDGGERSGALRRLIGSLRRK